MTRPSCSSWVNGWAFDPSIPALTREAAPPLSTSGRVAVERVIGVYGFDATDVLPMPEFPGFPLGDGGVQTNASGQESLITRSLPLLQTPGLPLFLMEQAIQMRQASMPVFVGEAARLCRSVLRHTLR
jgi:hypothetical protein